MQRLGCCFGLMVVLMLPACRSSEVAADGNDPDKNTKARQAELDPFVGEFTLFQYSYNGYYLETKRYGGWVKIEKAGNGYLATEGRGGKPTMFYPLKNPKQISPSEGSMSATKWLEPKLMGGDDILPLDRSAKPVKTRPQQGLELVQSFLVLHLVRGVGPASWWERGQLKPGEDVRDHWSYERKVASKGSRSERVMGLLVHRKTSISARPGDIIFTPIGKFMYFGKPDRKAFQSGWLKELTYGKPLFNQDGSLTDTGRRTRIYLKQRSP